MQWQQFDAQEIVSENNNNKILQNVKKSEINYKKMCNFP